MQARWRDVDLWVMWLVEKCDAVELLGQIQSAVSSAVFFLPRSLISRCLMKQMKLRHASALLLGCFYLNKPSPGLKQKGRC